MVELLYGYSVPLADLPGEASGLVHIEPECEPQMRIARRRMEQPGTFQEGLKTRSDRAVSRVRIGIPMNVGRRRGWAAVRLHRDRPCAANDFSSENAVAS